MGGCQASPVRKKEVRVLMVGPSRTARGGITEVLSTYERSELWQKYHCEWLETYDGTSRRAKVRAMLRALLVAPLMMSKKDIIHIHASYRTSFYRKSVFVVMAKLLHKKVIIHLHAPDPEPFSRMPLSLVSRIMLSVADRVVALSETWAKEIREIAPRAKIIAIPNPCCMLSPKAANTGTSQAVILCVGKLDDRKGFCDLIRAMPIILAEVPSAKLVFAGHGDIERGKQLATQLNVGSSVEFLGWLGGPAKADVFARASVFCLPSYAEGVPLAMLEAMSSKIPLVVTPVGGIPDVITHGYNGILVTPGRDAEIAGAIIDMLRHPDLRASLADAAYQTLHSRFSPDVVSRTLAGVYDELMINANQVWTGSAPRG